ncbi:MAG: GAF domain-containing protein [Deltaproteobacteria bacterium]|nr:MAG: GAF domain-containing protein [Deltaproteobacteria bacterium]
MAIKVERKFYLKEFKAISKAISSYEDLNLLFTHIVEGLCRTFMLKGCCIMLFDEREKQLFSVRTHGLSDEYVNKGPVLVDEKYSAFFKKEPVYIEDMQTSPYIHYPEAAKKEGIKSLLSIPIMCGDNVLGMLRMYTADVQRYNDEDIDSICVLALQLAVVIEKKGLENFLEDVKAAMSSIPPHLLKGL